MKLLNLTYLREVVEGNESAVKNIIELFLKQMPEEVFLLEKAIEAGDFKLIKGIAHKLKSSVNILGIAVLMEILNLMEEQGKREEDLEKIKELFEQMKDISDKVLEEIKEESF